MLSNFSNTLDGLRRISGSSSNDMGLARSAADELKDFVLIQHQIIIDYVQLKSIVTVASSAEIKDALTAMRHVTSALQEIASFHSNGLLASSFDVPFHQANEALKKAEKQVEALLAHVAG
ncbi:MAG: hypothetical protein ACREO7_11225 [Pseudoxanthomonas sp.]